MKRILLLLSLFLCGIVVAKAGANTDNDSIYTHDHVMKIHLAYPDSALHLLDVMDERQPEYTFLSDVQRSDIYCALDEYHLMLKYAERALQSDSLQKNSKYYMQAILAAVDANKGLDRQNVCIELLTKGIAVARETGSLVGEALCLCNMGECYFKVGQPDRAYECFYQGIQLCKDSSSSRLAPSLSFLYGTLVTYLDQDERYEEALKVCDERGLLIEKMKQYKDIPLGYIDQQLSYNYIKQAALLARLNRRSEANEAFRLFSQTESSRQPTGKTNSAIYYLSVDQYHKALEVCPAYELPDTISRDFLNWLMIQASAYKGLKQYDRALAYEERMIVIADSINARERKSEVAELSTIYNLQEKEWNLRQKDEQLRASAKIRNVLILALAFAVIALGVYMRYTRIVKRKNRILADRLDNIVNYEREIDDLQRIGAADEPEMPQVEVNESLSDTQLFKYIESLIRHKKPYLNSALSRQEMTSQLPISSNRFTQVLQGQAKMDFVQYITSWRLKHALNLIKIHPNYTVEAVSEQSGFSSLRQFQRSFKAAYGMSLSEYKKIRQQ